MQTQPIPAALLSGVTHAFQMAAHLPTLESVRLRVGVLSADDVMIAAETLQGLDQVAFVRDQLHLLGFSEHQPGWGAPTFGCDLLLKQLSPAAGTDQVLRNAAPTRWPPPGRSRTR